MRFILVVLLSLASAPVAHASGVSVASREVPLGPGASARVQAPFDLVGLHWQGRGTVSLRTRKAGVWSAWRPAAPEAEDGPDRLAGERGRAG
jgi:hypothetical protein